MIRVGRMFAVAGRDLLFAIRLATLELKVDAFVRALEERDWRDQPRAPEGTEIGGQWIVDVARVAAAAPRCEGVGRGGCQNGGTFGSSGMFSIEGKMLCWDCAIKYLGIQELPGNEKLNLLRKFDPSSLK